MASLTRRQMLGRASAILGLAPVGTFATQLAPSNDSNKKKFKIIVAGGHPGDPEYGCGGTIARFTAAGNDVVLLYLNEGEPNGSPASVKGVRVTEAKRACELLKARPLYAVQVDGAAVIDASHSAKFKEILEREQPNVVFTHWPIDNHADHRAISMLVYESWIRLGKRFAMYYYEVSNGEDTVQFAPTHYVNISEVAEQKRSACLAHASQAPGKFYPLQQLVTRFRGVESGHTEAEAFVRHLQSPPFDLP